MRADLKADTTTTDGMPSMYMNMWNLDAMIGHSTDHMVRDAAKSLKGEPPPPDQNGRAGPAACPRSRAAGNPLANVVVAALKEAFDRDHARLELERASWRSSGDERTSAAHRVAWPGGGAGASRLKLLGGTALIGWIAAVVALAVRFGAVSTAGRVALAVGWALLLGALGTAFTAQGRVSADIGRRAASRSSPDVQAQRRCGCSWPASGPPLSLLI